MKNARTSLSACCHRGWCTWRLLSSAVEIVGTGGFRKLVAHYRKQDCPKARTYGIDEKQRLLSIRADHHSQHWSHLGRRHLHRHAPYAEPEPRRLSLFHHADGLAQYQESSHHPGSRILRQLQPRRVSGRHYSGAIPATATDSWRNSPADSASNHLHHSYGHEFCGVSRFSCP